MTKELKLVADNSVEVRDSRLSELATQIHNIETRDGEVTEQYKKYREQKAYELGIRLLEARDLLNPDGTDSQAFGMWRAANTGYAQSHATRLMSYAAYFSAHGIDATGGRPGKKIRGAPPPELLKAMPEFAVRRLINAPQEVKEAAHTLARKGKRLSAPAIEATEELGIRALEMPAAERKAAIEEVRNSRIREELRDDYVELMARAIVKEFNKLCAVVTPSSLNPSLNMSPEKAVEFLRSQLMVGVGDLNAKVTRHEDGFTLICTHRMQALIEAGQKNLDPCVAKYAVPVRMIVDFEVGYDPDI